MALKIDKVKEKQQVHDNLMKAMNEQKNNNTTSDTVSLLKDAITETRKIEESSKNNTIINNIPEDINTKKMGRPKKYTGDRSKFTIYVSDEMMSYVDLATKCTFSDNRSDYIVKLIQKDMNENKEKYYSIFNK